MAEQPEQPPELTRQQLSQARVIAKGKRIRDVQRLVKQYGGKARQWVKKSSQPFSYQGKLAEVHWYEHHGIGRFEEKIKWLY
jgi:hypothetical protein